MQFDSVKEHLLPSGWVTAAIGDSSVVNPRTFLDPVEADRAVSFIPMAAVEAKTGRIDLSQVRTYGEVSKGYTRFSEGDVLFAKITPCMENGKIAIAKGLTNGCGCGSTEFHVLRTRSGLSQEFLYFFLLQDEFRKGAQRNMAGTAGQLRVPAAWLSEASIPLPPLAEQGRIVVEIETQFTRLDASVAALRRAQANLKRYRASVLKAACEGRLVPTEAELARSEGRELRTRRCPAGAHPGRAPRPLGVAGEAAGQVQGTLRTGHLRPAGTARGLGVGDGGAAFISSSIRHFQQSWLRHVRGASVAYGEYPSWQP